MKRILRGPRVVTEALRAERNRVSLVLVATGSRPASAVAAEARRLGVPVEERPRSELDAAAKGLRHQDVLAITGEYPYVELDALVGHANAAGQPPLLLALDSVQDVQNLGSLIRSAVGFGTHGVILCRHHSAPVSAAAVRASAGASEHAAVARVTNLTRTLRELKEQGFHVVGTDAGAGATFEEVDLAQPTVIVLGSEGKGLRRLVREACDVLAGVPLPGPIASLNVAVAGALALYEAQRQRGNKP